jgi:predicted MFS family arabinose efflux permease
VTGWLGDRMPRRFLIFGGVLIWSLATVASGLAPTFGLLLVARAFIGAGEAGYATVAPGLIADLFPADWRNRAMGVFNVVIPLGAAAGFGIGATVGQHYGWRTAFFVAGVPGLMLAVMALFLTEPERGAHDAPEQRGHALPGLESFKALFRNRAFLVNTSGQVLMTFTVGGLANWMPSFLTRYTGLSTGDAGIYFGVVTAVAGLLGTIAGTLTGEWAQRRSKRGYLLASGASLMLAAPFILIIASAPGLWGTLGAAFGALFFVLFTTAPLYTALLNAVPATMRSSAVAANILAIHILGDAISPPIIGAISDTTHSLAMAVGTNAIPVLLGGFVLLMVKPVKAEAA